MTLLYPWPHCTSAEWTAAAAQMSSPGQLYTVDDTGDAYIGKAGVLLGALVKLGTGGGGVSSRMFDVYDPAYGAVGDGVADDTAAINAAAAAAEVAGGTVDCSRGTFRITGPVKIGTGVGLIGQGEYACQFVCDSATASIQLGYNAAGDHYHPMLAAGFRIDMSGSGDPAGRLQVGAVKGNISRVHVTDTTVSGTTVSAMTPGNAVWFNGSQNMIMDALDADAVQGTALIIDNGSGGLTFRRCSITTSNILMRVTEQSPGVANGGGFPFGPACNIFDACIFETRLDDSSCLLSIEAGSMNWIRACQLSASTATARMMSGAMVNVTNDILFPGFANPFPTHVGFDTACTWNGGTVGAGGGAHPCAGISITGGNIVDVKAPQFIQNVGGSFLFNNAGAATCRFNPNDVVSSGSNGARMGVSGSASNAKQSIVLGVGVTGFTLTDTGHTTGALTPASNPLSVQTALQGLSSIGSGNVKVTGGSGAPFLVEFIGALASVARANLTITPTGGAGTITAVQVGGVAANIGGYYQTWRTGPSAAVGLVYDAPTASLATLGQFRVVYGLSRNAHIAAITTAAFVYAADTSINGETVFTYVNPTCSLGTLTLTNPVDGQLYTVTHFQPANGGSTFVWPANVQWKGPIPTECGNGEYVSVTFKYNAATTTWIEQSRGGVRQADVPDYVPTPKHRYDADTGLYNARSASGHARRAKFGKTLAGVSDTHLLVVSDSSLTGYPGGGAGSYVYDQNPMRVALRQLARKTGISWQQGLQWAVGDKSFGSADNWTLTGAFTHASVFLFCNGAGTATRAALPGETGTSVSISYSDLGTNGIPWKINGVSQTALPTGATNTIHTVTVSGLAPGAQVIQVAPTAGQNITITATRVWTPATKAVHLHHCGIGGSRISNATGTAAANDLNWSSTSSSGTYGLGYLIPATLASQAITPDGIIVSLGGNDLGLAGDPLTTAAQLSVMLAAIFPGVPVYGMMHFHKISTVTDAAHNLLGGALYGVADSLNTPMFDMDAWEGGIVTAAADGLIGTDGTHPKAELMQITGTQASLMLWNA